VAEAVVLEAAADPRLFGRGLERAAEGAEGGAEGGAEEWAEGWAAGGRGRGTEGHFRRCARAAAPTALQRLYI
jgi:hypothetical protein